MQCGSFYSQLKTLRRFFSVLYKAINREKVRVAQFCQSLKACQDVYHWIDRKKD